MCKEKFADEILLDFIQLQVNSLEMLGPLALVTCTSLKNWRCHILPVNEGLDRYIHLDFENKARTLIWQPRTSHVIQIGIQVYRSNCEDIICKIRLKIDLVSYPTQAEGLVNKYSLSTKFGVNISPWVIISLGGKFWLKKWDLFKNDFLTINQGSTYTRDLPITCLTFIFVVKYCWNILFLWCWNSCLFMIVFLIHLCCVSQSVSLHPWLQQLYSGYLGVILLVSTNSAIELLFWSNRTFVDSVNLIWFWKTDGKTKDCLDCLVCKTLR